ncbi:MAG: hypothetical protein IPJ58_16705 [Ardenticatenia bacterium]|nr:hypothetical protein [Ardenticatenia bacterium]
MTLLAIFAATLLAALSQGIESSPIIVAILALLALPGVTTIATSVIRSASDAIGVNPRVVVYVLSLVVTGLVLLSGGVDLPAWVDDPTAYVGAWIAWASANAGLAKTIYEIFHPKLVPATV